MPCCCCDSWVSQLNRTVGCFPPLEIYMVTFGTIKARPQKGALKSVPVVQGSVDPADVVILEE